jgi:hypothetical protein
MGRHLNFVRMIRPESFVSMLLLLLLHRGNNRRAIVICRPLASVD